jgi:hypothetical protein
VEVLFKNIILYGDTHEICGFAEINIRNQFTYLRVVHNFSQDNLLFSFMPTDSTNQTFPLSIHESRYEIRGHINLSAEVFACIIAPQGDNLVPLARGVINPTQSNIVDYNTTEDNTAHVTVTPSTKKEPAPKKPNTPEVPYRLPTEPVITEPNVDLIIPPPNRTEPKQNVPKPCAQETERTRAAREIDETLRKICTIDTDGGGVCSTCPYREYFYRFPLDKAK